MRTFTHIDATSVEDAQAKLAEYGTSAMVVAGGTDLIPTLNLRCFPSLPDYLINLKTIADMDYIREDAEGLKIGALAKLHDIAFSSAVTAKYSALAAAARAVASWQVRNMGTIGGNICQNTRCWYFRSSWNKFNCLRKSSQGACYAMAGNNRFHSVFGASNGCVTVNPGDTAVALVALDAKVKTNKRTIAIMDFFGGITNTVLAADEFVVEIQVPTPPAGSKQKFVKSAIRQAIDFATVNAACLITSSSGSISAARIALNAVAPKPIRATKAEEALIGKSLSDTVIAEAADAAVNGSMALAYNKYKIAVAKGMVKKALAAAV
jgi:xanthine dehydrogenase YagS FAD-binding subunit